MLKLDMVNISSNSNLVFRNTLSEIKTSEENFRVYTTKNEPSGKKILYWKKNHHKLLSQYLFKISRFFVGKGRIE